MAAWAKFEALAATLPENRLPHELAADSEEFKRLDALRFGDWVRKETTTPLGFFFLDQWARFDGSTGPCDADEALGHCDHLRGPA